ncbi:hypothetical protein [Candidatus Similichlamydia laticola]|uniref:Uncharacterized protein n=1 Tax=Candidatus Similichlamydia laticola TaxID=2170265 RepID=A0A369KC33_9BACT|nr:hypothetical protein [Candidatus Similichlamydia laticola]RDB31152.1 hypothetical protein HAT2_00746 [Candidatus Similichlamydia laticola]
MEVFWGDALTSFRLQETHDRDVLLYSCLSQNLFCCRLLAFELLSARGEINLKKCQKALDFLEKNLSCPWSGSEQWMKMNSQIVRVLRWLCVPEFLKVFYSIGPSCANPIISRIVLDTCFDSNNLSEYLPSPSLYQVRFAVLVSWMSYLGPGIISGPFSVPLRHLHEQCPVLFLLDLKQLVENGSLQRAVTGEIFEREASLEHLSSILHRHVRYTHQMSCLTPLAVALSMSGVFREHDPLAIRDCFEKHVFEWAHEKRCSVDEIIRHVLVKMYGLSDEMVRGLPSWPQGLVPKEFVMDFNSEKLFWDARLVLDHEKLSCSLFRRLCQSDLLCVWKDTLISLITREKEVCYHYLASGLGLEGKSGLSLLDPFKKWTKDRLDQLTEEEADLCRKMGLLEEHCHEIYSRSAQVNDRAAQWMKAELASLSWEKECYAKQRDQLLSRRRQVESFGQVFEEVCSKQLTRFFFLERVEGEEFVQHSLFPHMHFRLKGHLRGCPQTVSDWSLFWDIVSEYLLFCQKEASLSVQGLDPLDDRDVTDLATRGYRDKGLIAECSRRFTTFSQFSLNDSILHSPWEFSFKVSFEEGCRLVFPRESFQQVHTTSFCEEVDDFWVFLMDGVERSCTSFFESCSRNQNESLILSSPRSILLFRPGSKYFFRGVLAEIYPYTWIRDFFLLPLREKYCAKISPSVQRKMMDSFLDQKKLLKTILAERVVSREAVFPSEMRKRLANVLGKSHYRKDILRRFDAFFFKKLPIFSLEEVRRYLEKIVDLEWFQRRGLHFSVDGFTASLKEEEILFHDIVWSTLVQYICSENHKNSFPIHFFEDLLQVCVDVHFLPLPPVRFADSLVFGYDLAFVFNPGLDRLEVWNVRGLPYEGFPTRDELAFFGGDSPSMEWKIFLRGPSESFLNTSDQERW